MSDRQQQRRDRDDLAIYLAALFGREAASGRVEVRYRQPRGPMRQRFYSPQALQQAAPTLRVLARRHDVYLGVAPRTGRRGGLDAIDHSWALWIDCDGDTTALDGFDVSPSLRVASGSGPGHEHAYWLLNEPLNPERTAQYNRRLAGDLASADAARILRPPGTLSHKHQPPVAVRLVAFSGEVHSAEQLAGALPDPPPKPAPPAGPSLGDRHVRPRLLIGSWRFRPPPTSPTSSWSPTARARSAAPSTRTPPQASTSTRRLSRAGAVSAAPAAGPSSTGRRAVVIRPISTWRRPTPAARA